MQGKLGFCWCACGSEALPVVQGSAWLLVGMSVGMDTSVSVSEHVFVSVY